VRIKYKIFTHKQQFKDVVLKTFLYVQWQARVNQNQVGSRLSKIINIRLHF